MSLMQQAMSTYENAEEKYAGVYYEGQQEPLAPICHMIANAEIQITIDQNGEFLAASIVDKKTAKTIIPVTEESSARTSAPCPHPLCDQIGYLIPDDEKKYPLYLQQIKEWADSEYGHPVLDVVIKYVIKGTLKSDLMEAGLLSADETGNVKEAKSLVRWIIEGIDDESGPCWKNRNLQKQYIGFFKTKTTGNTKCLCMLTGKKTISAKQHLKGIVSINGNAKIISANDSSGFTYRGRFADDKEALSVGYEASQKAHNALKWLVANQSDQYGRRAFLCWNPEGKKIIKPTGFLRLTSDKDNDRSVYRPSDYREELHKRLMGWKKSIPEGRNINTVIFDAATTGRLAVVYYSELPAVDFFERLYEWEMKCCWPNGKFGIQSPLLPQIAAFAYGSLRNDKMEPDDKLNSGIIQRLLECRLNQGKIPQDIVRKLVVKCQNLQIYKNDESSKWLRNKLLFITCAVLRKYHIDYFREEWEMSLDVQKADRSYQYGRLLAIMEKIERDTYDLDEKREPNAIRMQSVFVQRPEYASRIIMEQLKKAYYPRLGKPVKTYYEKTIGQIMEVLSQTGEELNKALGDSYLMGYYLQKNEMYTKKEKTEE